jgi:hypothetical protein
MYLELGWRQPNSSQRRLFVGPFACSDKVGDWLKKNEEREVNFIIRLTEPSDDLDEAAAMLGMWRSWASITLFALVLRWE